MISLFKGFIQKCARLFGYRIVPKARDAQSFLEYVERLPVTSVVDVGANAGHTCVRWLTSFPLAHVHAIEALEQFQPALENIATTHLGRMTIWPFAASNKDDNLTFYYHEDHPSSSSLLASTPESHLLLPFTRNAKELTVKAVRLDRLFSDANIDLGKGVFLKLDVQGGEMDVLKGCEGFLNRVVCVLCEINLKELYEGQPRFIDILLFLQSYGLRFSGVTEQFHDEEGQAIYFDAIFLRGPAIIRHQK